MYYLNFFWTLINQLLVKYIVLTVSTASLLSIKRPKYVKPTGLWSRFCIKISIYNKEIKVIQLVDYWIYSLFIDTVHAVELNLGQVVSLSGWILHTVAIHSQKQSAHWAEDVTAQVVPCWLGSWLNRNFLLVQGQWTQLAFQFIQLDITWFHCLNAADSCDIQLSERKITWVNCIRTPESSLHLISPLNWISTESWLRWWYTVGWAVSSESV